VQVFHILLSLSDGPAHGYAIIQEVRTRTNDEVRLTASTLYDALGRLVEEGWIAELDEPPDPAEHDSRRRYYELTRLGREAAEGEVRRMQQMVEMARKKRLWPAAAARGRK